jgi:hypothetical protein
MKSIQYLAGLLLALTLAACGGGGGSAGTSSGGSGSGTGTGTGTTAATAVVAVPTIGVSIVDASGVAVPSNAIGSGSLFYAKAVVKDEAGVAVASKLVTFTTPVTVATLSQASALTDSTGVAKVRISPVSLTLATAGNLVASATVNTVSITSDVDYQTSAANVSLANFLVGQSSISALQTSSVSVQGLVNNVAAGSSTVTVGFSASCGSFSPASASSNSAGLISSTYQSDVTCSGPVTLTAQATGASPVTAVINVAAALAANIIYSSASVPLMVTSSAASGLKQSAIKFQVLNGGGTGMAGQNVSISLAGQAISSGVTFSVGGAPSTAVQLVPTDGSGFAAVTVSSGTLPTPVVVTAVLVSNTTVTASSSGVAVTSGKPTQDKASLSVDKFSLEAFRTDGVQATLTMRVSDRLSNPIPPGATVNFIASHSLVQGTCTVDAQSLCNVTLTSQGTRPANGRVAILAYMDGEESFVDLNGDNIWQPGEPFSDVGTLFRDDNENALYDAASEQTIPGGMTGSSVCSTSGYPSVANSCDGTWSSSIRIRKQTIVALATSDAVVSLISPVTIFGFTVRIADANGNSMPTGSTVTAVVGKAGTPACALSAVSPNVVRNSPDAGNHDIFLNGEPSCASASIDVTVTTPAGVRTTYKF